jgi:leucyl-tRNA synthetase
MDNSDKYNSLENKSQSSPAYQTADKLIAKQLIGLSRNNRKEATESEALLWNIVRNKNLGYKFRRQHAIGRYIADFACTEKRLVIEIDGSYHNTKEQLELDEQRTLELEQKCLFKVIRFTNEEVSKNMDSVIVKIKAALLR